MVEEDPSNLRNDASSPLTLPNKLSIGCICV
jgi:hypothetical protein